MNKYVFLLLLPGILHAEDLPTQHTVQPKDTLWDLAQHYYHDPFKWRSIAEANPPPTVHDPHWIYPEQVLQIPALAPVPQPAQNPAPPAEAPAAEPPQEPAPEPPQAAEPPAQATLTSQPQASKPPQPPPREELSETGLSNGFPGGMVGSPPSLVRFKAAPGWRADGEVQKHTRDGEKMLSQGDPVVVRITAPGEIRPHDQYLILRVSGPTDEDSDQHAKYLSQVGLLEIRSQISRNMYRGLILRSSDAIQVGDMIQKR